MAEDRIGYGRLVEEALRQVVRDALDLVGREGLPDPHHFYITFHTDHPGVEISEHLRRRYPSEMTIVVQYQFWGLEVDEDGFEVTLSFGGVPERLRVPFRAVRVFADPGVEFGLQFQVADAPAPEPGQERPEPTEEVPEGPAEVVSLDRFRKK